MNAPWLFAEAYKYRRLRECFSVSKYWNQYDVFYRQKVHTSPGPLYSTTRLLLTTSKPTLAERHFLAIIRSRFRVGDAFRFTV